MLYSKRAYLVVSAVIVRVGADCWDDKCPGKKNMCDCMGYPEGTEFMADAIAYQASKRADNSMIKGIELDGYKEGSCGYANAICDTKWAVVCCEGDPLGTDIDPPSMSDEKERILQTVVLFESAPDFCARNGYTSDNFMVFRTAYPGSGSIGPTGYPSGSCGTVVADGEDLFAQCCCLDEAFCCPQGEDSDDCMATQGLDMLGAAGGSYSFSFSYQDEPMVGIPDTHCPLGGDDLDRSVCMENGEHDDDCCAMLDSMGCEAGFTTVVGDACDDSGYYTTCCYSGCADSTSWHKKDDTSKDCDWVASKTDTRCNVKGEAGIRASYACPAACGTTCYDSSSWYKKNDPSKDCSWVHFFPQKRCFVKGNDGTLASYSCATTCGSDSYMDSTEWYKRNDPSKDCAWVSTLPDMRCSLTGEDGTTASYSCPAACGSDTSLQDSEIWYKKGDSSKDCAWVSTFSSARCDTVGWDDSLASSACPYACA